MNTNRKIAIAASALVSGVLLTGCAKDAAIVNENLRVAANQFELERRVIFFNGITDQYLLTIEGRCSIKDENSQLEVICKTGPEEFKKHFLGLSDNVTYFVEQTEAAEASVYNYRVVFKPETVIPDIDIETSGDLERDGKGNS